MAQTIGILGAGKLGITLAELAVKAGYAVMIAGSGDPEKIRLSVTVLAPGAVPTTQNEAIEPADLVVLAIPLRNYKQLPVGALASKLVIDAANYWWETDGDRKDFMPKGMSTSEAIQQFLPESRVVKALSHMSYHDLHDEARAKGANGRKAIAVAGDNETDIAAVSEFIDMLGFDPLPMGTLKNGQKLEPGGSVFGANVDSATLQELLLLPAEQSA